MTGADGYGALPLANVRAQYNTAAAKLDAAQRTIQAGADFQSRGGSFDAGWSTAYRQAQADAAQYQPLVNQLGGELNARQTAMTQAQQQRDQVASNSLATKQAYGAVLRAQQGDGKLGSDLASVLQGGTIPQDRAAVLQSAGLISPLQDNAGQAGFHVTGAGYGLLPKDVQATVASNPLVYRLDDAALADLSMRPAAGVPRTPAADLAAVTPQIVPPHEQRWAIQNEFPDVMRPASTANRAFLYAYQLAGSDPSKSLAVAQALFGGMR